jgi:APA family basic amino acid/polyamine antiporter
MLPGGRSQNLPGQNILPWVGILISLYLILATPWLDKVMGIIVILIGIPLYVLFSPKQDIRHLKEGFLSEEAIFLRYLGTRNQYLANFIQILYKAYKGFRGLLGS